eukprot:22953_1
MTTEECVAQTRANGCDIANIGFQNQLDPLSQIENELGSCWCQYGQDTTEDDGMWYSCFFKESGNGGGNGGGNDGEVCSQDAIKFDWDELTEDGLGKPDVTFTINVDESPQTDLSLNIEVRVPYIVRA